MDDVASDASGWGASYDSQTGETRALQWLANRATSADDLSAPCAPLAADLCEQRRFRCIAQASLPYTSTSFTYVIPAFLMAYHGQALALACPMYPWYLEAMALIPQAFLSYLNDVHCFGLNRKVQKLDRAHAAILTLVQPLKLRMCPEAMDSLSLAFLIGGLIIGLAALVRAKVELARKNVHMYMVFHGIWHVACPLAGTLWILRVAATVSSVGGDLDEWPNGGSQTD